MKCLKPANRGLLQQFVVWQYNGYAHRLSEHEFKELPILDRGQTDTQQS